MAEHGSGFDVVSGGELYRVGLAGGRPGGRSSPGSARRTRRSPPGLEAGVLMFNVESEAELDAIARVAAAMGVMAPVALRVNPDVDPKTHRYISTGKKESKFGMDIDRSLALAEKVGRAGVGRDDRRPHAHRVADHDDRGPYAGAAGKAVEIIAELRGMGHPIAWFNMGGGFGIGYRGGEALSRSPSSPERWCRLDQGDRGAGWRWSRGG